MERTAELHPPPVNEGVVARLWDAQHPFSVPLRTVAGEVIHVVYRGRRRFDRGPDFPGALVAFENNRLVSGDIEVHVRTSDWRRHGHHRDPAYDGVILHVVLWHDTTGASLRHDGTPVPVLELAPQLAAPLEELLLPSRDEPPRPSPCSPGSADSPQLSALLEECGMERFEARVRRFTADLECLPEEELLYRGIADVLGFSHNRTAFALLAEAIPLANLLLYSSTRPTDGDRTTSLEALLLGAAGLLPSQRGNLPEDPYGEGSEAVWDRDGDVWADRALSAGEWRFFRVRPANFPGRRIAGLASAVSRWPETGLAPLLAGLVRDVAPKKLPRGVESLLVGHSEGGYWAGHCDFGMPLPRASDPVGRQRAAEAAVNLFLPFVAARAARDGDSSLGEAARAAYQLYPKRGDNEITRYVAAQITGVPRPPTARSAARQQGLLHIFRTWCDVKQCGGCPVAVNAPIPPASAPLPRTPAERQRLSDRSPEPACRPSG